MKKNIFFLIVFSIIGLISFSQVKNPVSWTFSSKKTANAVYEVHCTAIVEKGWHIYSQSTPEGGPVPTAFVFIKNPLIAIDGKTKEVGRMDKHNEPLFGVDVFQYSDKVDFVQIVKVKSGAKTNITGSVEFMLCNNKECLPPAKQEFSIALK